MDPASAASAPGKVLLAGGYLVLDRNHTGLVFGLDARIHVHVGTCNADALPPSTIIVRSPQFRDAEWRYAYRGAKDNGGTEVIQLKDHSTCSQSRNKFVETALAYALTYVSARTEVTLQSASVTIIADTDYYSRPESTNDVFPVDDQRFLDFKVPLHEAHKTGLGSSAALVTALAAAVMSHFLPQDQFSLASDLGKARLHSVAQAAHCAAQGKIGSGFDVAAAVYGSCVYRRFSPSILEDLGDVGSKGFSHRLVSITENVDSSKSWDMEIVKSYAIIPRGLRLIMCDIDCGSETVGMVKKVIAWRKANPQEAALLWGALQKGNEDLAEELRMLALQFPRHPSDYENLRTIFLTIRSLIRELSAKARVPIEPRAQTDFLDVCCRADGVIGGVVPGAGGFDAVVLIVEDREDVVKSLQHIFNTYQVDARYDDEPSIGRVRLLGVKQEAEGVKMEDSDAYVEWIE